MEYLLKTKSIGGLTEEQFFQLCQENDAIKLERDADGMIIIQEPTGSYTGLYNLGLTAQLYIWNSSRKLGVTFDSNTGFTLPNKAVRSPDGAFITTERWEALPKSDRLKFAHICPDFAIELRSENDSRKILEQKMDEWMTNGCAMAWLVDPQLRETVVYRKHKEPEVRSFSVLMDGQDVLPGFTIDLVKIFQH
jgi:Uma2 family endonuclease